MDCDAQRDVRSAIDLLIANLTAGRPRTEAHWFNPLASCVFAVGGCRRAMGRCAGSQARGSAPLGCSRVFGSAERERMRWLPRAT